MPRYWINLFTPRTWEESRSREYKVTGHRAATHAQAHAVRPGDLLFCYVTKASVVAGVQRVVHGPYVVPDEPENRIWAAELYPVRFDVELEVRVPVALGVALDDLRRISDVWVWLYRRSLNEVPQRDADCIMAQLRSTEPKLSGTDAEPASTTGTASPVAPPTPVSAAPTPSPDPSATGPVEQPVDDTTEDGGNKRPERRETRHTEIQYRLARLGQEMGLKVWIARNDRTATWEEHRLGDLSLERLRGTSRTRRGTESN